MVTYRAFGRRQYKESKLFNQGKAMTGLDRNQHIHLLLPLRHKYLYVP